VAAARRFTPSQRAAFGRDAWIIGAVDLAPDALARFVAETGCDLVVNCIGVLQDSARGAAVDVHAGFTARLVAALAAQPKPVLLVQLSVPGRPQDDRTAFSRTKREAERQIAHAPGAYAILRPGFVIGPAAYGGSALIRALAALPVSLPEALASRPFAATDIADIAETIARLARRWADGERDLRLTLDVMETDPSTVGEVIAAFRARFGGPRPRLTLPGWLLAAGSRAGDAAALAGWSPPVRSTALAELRRGVEGDGTAWAGFMDRTPPNASAIVTGLPASVQERWFARLYLAKALAIGGLALFWIVSGLVALGPAFGAAAAILTAHGVPPRLATVLTTATSLADIAIGLAIAWRRTCRAGLLAGLAVTFGYLASATMLTPELWIDPLGALVKTGPAAILMLFALLILDDRG